MRRYVGVRGSQHRVGGQTTGESRRKGSEMRYAPHITAVMGATLLLTGCGSGPSDGDVREFITDTLPEYEVTSLTFRYFPSGEDGSVGRVNLEAEVRLTEDLYVRLRPPSPFDRSPHPSVSEQLGERGLTLRDIDGSEGTTGIDSPYMIQERWKEIFAQHRIYIKEHEAGTSTTISAEVVAREELDGWTLHGSRRYDIRGEPELHGRTWERIRRSAEQQDASAVRIGSPELESIVRSRKRRLTR